MKYLGGVILRFFVEVSFPQLHPTISLQIEFCFVTVHIA